MLRQTRRAMKVLRNITVRSRNHCCRKNHEVLSIMSVYPSIFLPQLSGMQSASAVLYYHLLVTLSYHIFPHYLIKRMIFEKNKLSQNVCFDCIYNLCLKHFSF